MKLAWRLTAPAVLVAVVLAGCGNGGEETETTEAAARSTTEARDHGRHGDEGRVHRSGGCDLRRRPGGCRRASASGAGASSSEPRAPGGGIPRAGRELLGRADTRNRVVPRPACAARTPTGRRGAGRAVPREHRRRVGNRTRDRGDAGGWRRHRREHGRGVRPGGSSGEHARAGLRFRGLRANRLGPVPRPPAGWALRLSRPNGHRCTGRAGNHARRHAAPARVPLRQQKRGVITVGGVPTCTLKWKFRNAQSLPASPLSFQYGSRPTRPSARVMGSSWR